MLTYTDYLKAISFKELIKATDLCKRNVYWKDSVIKFNFNKFKYCSKLHRQLINNEYKIQNYSIFKINDPKPRIITATRFRDRVLQRSLCENGLYDAFVKPFIYDNLACQKNKGTTKAIQRIIHHLKQFNKEVNGNINNCYYLKLDIKRYFENTPHNALKIIVKRYIKEPNFVNHVYQIIDSFKDKRSQDEINNDQFGKRGIGLGSQISQLLQLLYLNDLDHYIKEQLKIKHYIRYMDDMLLLVKDKATAYKIFNKINQFIINKGLELNKKSKISKISNGILYMKNFYKIKNNKIKKRCYKKVISREIKRLNKFNKLLKLNKITVEYIQQHLKSINGFLKWRCNKKQIKYITNHINTLKFL